MIFSAMPPGVREALSAKRVLIAGAGGLGSNAAMLLVRSGIGELEIFDFDTVAASNLNRQFFFADQIGMKKTDALAANLRRIDPGVKLVCRDARLDAGNCAGLLDGPADLVLECFDRAEDKALLVRYVLARHPARPLIAVSGIGGVGGPAFGIRRGPGNLYVIGDGESDAAAGTLAGRVMLAAAAQAQLAVEILLKEC